MHGTCRAFLTPLKGRLPSVDIQSNSNPSNRWVHSEAMPSQVSALHQKGQKLYQKGDFRAAIEIFGEVDQVHPNPKRQLMMESIGTE